MIRSAPILLYGDNWCLTRSGNIYMLGNELSEDDMFASIRY
jgi:hypothetical protein